MSPMTQTSTLAFALEEILTAARAQCNGESDIALDEDVSDFLRKYCADASMEDFAQFSAADAARQALDLWTHMHNTPPGERLVHIGPCLGADDRDMERTVISIVGPDLPFLVNSVVNVCSEANIETRALTHPVIHRGGDQISFIQVQVEPLNPARQQALQQALEETLDDVASATRDFTQIRTAMQNAVNSVSELAPSEGCDADDISEAADFLQWLVDDHFIFLGARSYRYARGAEGDFTLEEPAVVPGSGLGVLKNEDRHILSRESEPVLITPRIRAFLTAPSPLIVAKSNMRTRVHRRSYADYIGVKQMDADGHVVGETRFVGLFTSSAYNRMARDMPLIRRKIEQVSEMLEVGARNYSSNALTNVLETYPRDELFQIDAEELAVNAQNILALQQRPRTRLFVRRDLFDRYVSALLYTPRDTYTPELRRRAHTAIAEAFGGRESAFYPSFSDGPLARVHYIVGLNRDHPEPDIDALDLHIRQLAETWEDGLSRASRLGVAPDIDHANVHFNAAYKESFPPEEALRDLSAIAAMAPDATVAVRTHDHMEDPEQAGCKIYRRDQSIDLSDMVPVLENMGLRVLAETGYPITLRSIDTPSQTIWVHDIMLERPSSVSPLGQQFEEGFIAVWNGQTENDGFNQLIVQQEMTWRQAALLRTLCRYRQQTGLDPSEAVQINALVAHPDIAREIVRLFDQRFAPQTEDGLDERRQAGEVLVSAIMKALDDVASLDHDRVLRRLTHLVEAIQRTNFYQLDASQHPYPYISIKIASQMLDDLPAPKPFREIFIWSPEVEGVHLRFGPVARGGLRWSDRRDDFRTEVLGLVKAQQVKNAVIVPVGSKGGFFPKQLPINGAREDTLNAGVSAYKVFISALLEITDTLVDGHPVRPQYCVAWDGDDPYLVVAADKGTATFSDIANQLSAEHGFWLGDAFASGGSAGYDHKKMGITARGGWEAVKRHFREIGKDIQTEHFTAIGVGDMSGDVFGNGMLLSKQTQLLAAFNHMHIFIDPNPDPAMSWVERKRLFDTPRTNWADYDPRLISAGGGVFSRSSKSIALTPEIRALIGREDTSLPPDALIKALLQCQAELLWFGGIGTYVKATDEQHAQAGDKANDALRINGEDLNVQIIGEGANLGVTQAGRIEFARKGGRINTDAIDNSAGVDSSDHEVNIKILLTEAIRSGELEEDDRNALLASMTDDVAEHVLCNNYEQTGALSLLETTAPADLDAYAQLMTTLETEDKLNRVVEGLPQADKIAELRELGLGLSRPEISVLMAYAKNDLLTEIVAGNAPDEAAFQPLLKTYFPSALDKFEGPRNRHRLKREIIATRLSNRLVNLSGPFYPYEMRDGASIDITTLVKASEAARAVFGVDALLARIDALDNKAPASVQIRMYQEATTTMRQMTGAFVAPLLAGETLSDLIARYHGGVATLRAGLMDTLSPFLAERVESRAATYTVAGAPADLALSIASLRAQASIKETIDCALHTDWPLDAVARIQHAIGSQLHLDQLRAAARDTQLDGHWERLAQQRVTDALPEQQANLTIKAVRHARKDGCKPDNLNKEAANDAVRLWLASMRESTIRVTAPIENFEAGRNWNLAKLVLVGDALREFVQNSPETV